MAENAEVGNGISSITRSAKNLPADMAKDAEVDGNGNGNNDEIVEKLPFKKLSGLIEYFISLRSRKKWVSPDSFGHCWSFLLKALLEKL